MHTPQCANNLLGRPTPQRAVWVQLGQWPRGKATGFTGGISGSKGIALARLLRANFRQTMLGLPPSRRAMDR